MEPSQSISALPDHLLYKNRLQEYAQKSALPLPVYQTINEGFPHAPKFRSTVLVDGTNYASKLTFSQRKAAEQDVAKQALDCIQKKIKESPPITKLEFQDPMGYKSILHEFAVKSNRKIPSYRTRTEGRLGPVFVSSVLFDSKIYTGEVSGSKKVAEQLAAAAAIHALLGSDIGNLLHEIVKSKGKIHSASPSVKELSIVESVLPIDYHPETPSEQPRNISQPIATLNSSDRVMSPITEEKRVMESQSWESGKRLNVGGTIFSSNRERNSMVKTQNAVNSSCVRMASPYAGVKRANETQNVQSNKRVDHSCARMTSPYAGAKRASETQNIESKKIVNNSCTRMTGPTAEGKHKMETPPRLEQKSRFNSLGIMISPYAGEKCGNETQNVESKKRVTNSCARMTNPYAGAKRASETQNVQSKKIVNNSCTRMTGPTAEGNREMETPPSLEQKNRFNSLGMMVGTTREGKRKLPTQNLGPRKSFNSAGRMISPDMEGTRRIQHQKFEPKKQFLGFGI